MKANVQVSGVAKYVSLCRPLQSLSLIRNLSW